MSPGLLISLLLLVGSPAEEHLTESQQWLSQLEDRKAADSALAGLKLNPPEPVAARLLIVLGLARFNMLDAEGARRAFRAAAVADPQATPPDEANPRAVALFGEARAESRTAEPSNVLRYAGIAIGGLGVAALASGGGFGFSSQLARNHAVSTPSAESAEGELTLARTRATTANVLFIAGGVLAIAGGLLSFLPIQGGGAVSFRTSY
jgi:hypothetical protein